MLEALPATVVRQNQEFAIDSPLPVFSVELLSGITEVARHDGWFALAIITRSLLPAYNHFQGTSPPLVDRVRFLLADPRLQAVALKLEIAVALRKEKAAAGHEHSAALVNLRNLSEKVSAALISLETGAGVAKAQIDEQLRAYAEEAEKRLTAAKEQVTESEIFKSATALWTAKARSHQDAYRGWLLLIIVAVLALIGIVFIFGPELYARLPKAKDSNEATYLVVAVCVASVVGLGWLLRFFGRFVVENLSMHQDAQQRAAMLQVYLHLIGDPASKIEATDRALIINAVFRPLPGHQSEDVAPPTLADLIKSATAPKS